MNKGSLRVLSMALAFVLLLFLAWPAPAYAAGPGQGRVIFGESFTLAAGETVDGNLVVFGGSVTIEQGALVRGDVAVFGGSATVAGEVVGDLVVFGGSADLQAGALVHSDVVTLGGQVQRDPEAQVLGQIVENPIAKSTFRWAFTAPWGSFAAPGVTGQSAWMGWFLRMMVRLTLGVVKAVVLAALAALLVLFAEAPTRLVGQTALTRPLETSGVGLLTLLVAPVLMILLAITLVGIPLALLLGAALGLATLYGWLALAAETGERLAQTLNLTWTPPANAALGAFVLYIVVAGAGLIPCIGWLVGLLVLMMGLGSTLLTRLGTHPYPQTLTVTSAPSSSPPDTPPAATAQAGTEETPPGEASP